MVVVTNKVKKCWKQYEMEAVFDAISMVCNYYNLDVDGRIFVDFLKPNKYYDGLCSKISKKEVKIKIFKDEEFFTNILSAVHEATHAKQFLTQELDSTLNWHGTGEYRDLPYDEQPWEIEAIKMEEIFLGEGTKTY